MENPTNFYFLLGTKIQGINHGYNFKLLSAITPETKNRNVVFSLFYLFIGVDNNFLLTWREGILGNIGEYWPEVVALRTYKNERGPIIPSSARAREVSKKE